jgi:hypothetical protein
VGFQEIEISDGHDDGSNQEVPASLGLVDEDMAVHRQPAAV